MTEIVYDPKTKQFIKDELYTVLYQQVNDRYTTNLDSIIERNSFIKGNDQRVFVHDGEMIKHSQFNPSQSPGIARANRLDESLLPVYNSLLEERKRLNNQELPYVLGYITQVLNLSNSFDDYIRLLPDALHSTLESLRQRCPCRHQELPPEKVEQIKLTNLVSIDLMKQRLLSNLLMV